MRHHLRLGSTIAIIATVAALLGACGSSAGAPATNAIGSPIPTAALTPTEPPVASGPAGAESALDECSLLTASEIEQATGYEVAGSTDERTDGLSDCEWTLADQGGTIGLQVELDSPRAQEDHTFDCTVGFGMAPLPGVGDSACGDPIDAGGYRVYVLRGDDLVSLRMQADYGIDKSAWTTLARAVVARLP